MIHVFSMNGYNFAVDGNSGSIHVLDDISYQILNEVQMPILLEGVLDRLSTKYSKEELTEAYKEIQSLQEQGLLFTDHENIEEVLVKQNTNHVNALCLHVAHDCNLRCQYCFASKGDYKSGRSLMSKEVALKSVDYLVHHSGKRHNIEIDFFWRRTTYEFRRGSRSCCLWETDRKRNWETFLFHDYDKWSSAR